MPKSKEDKEVKKEEKCPVCNGTGMKDEDKSCLECGGKGVK